MKILLVSYAFAPSVGGIETVSLLLAREFIRAGHEIRIVTDTLADAQFDAAYPEMLVARRPGRGILLKWHAWADVVFHNNISMNYAWPLLLVRRPWVIAHHVWLAENAGWRGRLKGFALRFARNLAVSRAIADKLPAQSEIVGDPYDDEVFFESGGPAEKRELIYAGRLVSDKGVDLLLEALKNLKRRGCNPRLTVVGGGSDKMALEKMALEFGIRAEFTGSKPPAELAGLLRTHRIQVIPSKWEEPFGIVALEGLACGCRLIVAESGGLVEAAGQSAVIFKRGDVAALEAAIAKALDTPPPSREERIRHLQQFKKAEVARRYLEIFQQS